MPTAAMTGFTSIPGERSKKWLVGRIAEGSGTRPERSILRAHWVIGLIQRLYDVEEVAKGKPHQERRELRQRYSAPLLEVLRTWMDGQQFLPKSPTG
jgi:hypothetical protein